MQAVCASRFPGRPTSTEARCQVVRRRCEVSTISLLLLLPMASAPAIGAVEPTPAAELVFVTIREGLGSPWLASWGGPPFWYPSREQLDEVRAALPEFFRRSVRVLADGVDQRLAPADYVYQVLGISREGKRFLLINAYCTGPPREEFVVVLDGGSCFFSTLYDFEKHEFGETRVNGYA